MNYANEIKNLGYEIKPMKFETVKCGGFDDITNVWLKYRDEYLERKEDGSVVNIKNGKKYTKEEYDAEIFNMDLSVNYMEMILLNIKSSTAFREFIFQFESLSRWGMSSRDHAEFLTYCGEELSDLKSTYNAYVKFKEVQDNFKSGTNSFDAMRECLPVAYQTEFMIYLPVKQFIKYLSVFYRYHSKTLPKMWKCIYTAAYENDDLRPWLPKILQYLDTEEARRYGNISKRMQKKDVFINSSRIYKGLGEIGSVLYSQLIRMENSLTYGYVNFLNEIPNMEISNCKVPFKVWSAMSEDRVLEIMRTRTAWFASNTYDYSKNKGLDNNAWNAFMTNHWVRTWRGEIRLEDNYQFFKFFRKDKMEVDNSVIDRYLADDENRFHKDYNRFWISPFILEDPRIMIDRLNQQGYCILVDLYCQMYKKGFFTYNPFNKYQIQWYKWIDEENASNTDYRKWDEVWQYYMNHNISIINLMKKFHLCDY